MENKIIKCVVCPNGCDVSVVLDGTEVKKVEGNECKRGMEYAVNECLHPVRMVASTVKVKGTAFPVAAVRTDRAIPKEKIMDCMTEIRQAEIQAPLKIGDLVIRHVAGTEANIIVTRAN